MTQKDEKNDQKESGIRVSAHYGCFRTWCGTRFRG